MPGGFAFGRPLLTPNGQLLTVNYQLEFPYESRTAIHASWVMLSQCMTWDTFANT